MKKLHRWFSRVAIVSLIAQTFAPALPVFAAPTPGSTWVDSFNATTANIRVSTSEAAYIRIEYGTGSGNYTLFFPSGSTATRGSTAGYINSTPWYMNEQITGLSPSTRYYYRVGVCGMSQPTECINNPQTAYSYTAEQTFTTTAPQDTAPPSAFAVSLKEKTLNSITLKWNTPSDSGTDGGTHVPARYEVRYYKNFTFGDGSWSSATTAAGTLPTPMAVGAEQTFAATGLDANTRYCFGVKAYDQSNNATSIEGANFCENTLAATDTTPPPQTPFTISDITASSVKLNWTAPSDPDANANPQAASRYEIKYRATTSLTEDDWASATWTIGIPTPAVPGTQQSMTVPNLTAATSYTFGIKAFDAASNGSPLSVATATTLAAAARVDTTAPDRVTGVSGSPNPTSIFLQWLAPMDRNGEGVVTPVSRYEVRYKTSYSSSETEWWPGATAVANPPTPLGQGSTQYFTVSNLQSGTMYYFSIKAYDAAGNGSQFSLPLGISTSGSAVGTNNTFPAGNAVLEVQVSSNTSGSTASAGVNRAKVYLYSDPSCTPAGAQGAAQGETGSSGRYSFSGVPSGSYKLRVDPPSDRTDLMSMTWGCITLNQGTLLQGVMMPPAPTQPPAPSGSTLSITVRDTSGATVSGARVEACGPTTASACITLEAGTVAGTYLLKNAMPGTYALRAYPPSSRDDLEMISDSVTTVASVSAERSLTLPKRQTTPTPNYGTWPQTKESCDNYYGLWCPPSGTMSMGSCMMAGQSCSMATTCWNGSPMTSGACPSMPQTETECRSKGLNWCTSGGWGGCSMGACMPAPPSGKMICPDAKTFASTVSECPKKAGTVEPEPKADAPAFSGVWSGAITQSSAMIYYSIDKPATVTLDYKRRLDDPWMSAGTQTIAAGESYANRTFSLSGLTAGTTYFYRLTASGSTGSSIYPGATVPPAQFVTMFETVDPGSSLAKGSAGLTVIVKDDNGTPIANATVGLSSCASNTATAATGSHTASMSAASSPYPYRPCSWASSPTSQSGLVAFTNILHGEYTIGVSPSWSSNGNREYDYVTDYRVTLSENEKKDVTVTLKKIGSSVLTDLSLSDIRMEHMTRGFEFATWIRWYTPRPASGRIEYGTTAAYESPAFELPGFASYHEGKLQLKPETMYYYRLKSQDERGVMGSATGTFTTPKAGGDGDDRMPFGIDWRKVNPQPGSPLPVNDAMLHIEFSQSVDQSTLSRDAISFAPTDRSAPPHYALEPFSNGFNIRITDRLKPNTSYALSIASSVKSTGGIPLPSYQHLNFYSSTGDFERRGNGSITGTVKLLNGSTVGSATVVARGPVSQKQPTNDRGEYTFSGLPAGMYSLEVYLPSYLGDYAPPALPSIAVGEENTIRQDIVLAPSEFVIQGLVSYEDGSPVTDAMVGAYQSNGGHYIPPTPVDENGHFKLLVSEGTWTVGVMQKMMNFQCDKIGPCPMTVAASMIAMPNWNMPEKQTVAIGAGSKVRDVLFKVTKYKYEGMVKGTLARRDGGSVDPSNTSVRIVGRGGVKNFARSIEISVDGSFSTPLSPGLYDLYVETSDPNLSAPSAQELRMAGNETKDIGTLFLESANLTIKGTVRNERGNALTGITVQAWNKESGTTLSETTGTTGAFIINVSRGDWIVYAATSDKYSSTRGGTVFIPAKKLPAKNVNFAVQENTAFVRGSIVDDAGKKLSDVNGYVHARAKSGNAKKAGYYGMGAPVNNGEFSLTLPGGAYTLVFEPPQNSFVVAKKDVGISVKPGETKDIALEVEDTRSANAAALVGSLTDSTGAAVQGVPFTVYAGNGNRWYTAMGDQATGRYAMKLPAGAWYVGYEVKDDSYAEYQRGSQVTLKEGDSKELNLIVRRASAYVSGKTLDANGNPLPNVSIMMWPTGGVGTTGMADNSTYSDEEGAFEFYTEPGAYAIRAMIGEDSELTNPEEQKIMLKDGGEEVISFTFVPGTITVKGKTTVNGKAVVATVWAWSNNRGMKEFESDGSFSFKALPGDTWHFSAAADVDRCMYRAENVSQNISEKGKNSVSLALVKTGACLSAPVTVTGDADKPLVVQNPEGVKVSAPANAATTSGAVDVSITPEAVPASHGTERIVGQSYDIRVRTDEGADVKSFNSDLRVTLPYDPAEVKKLGVAPSDLSMKYWDGNAWQQVESCIADAKANSLTCSVDHATRFAIVAPPKSVASPSAKAAVKGKKITLAIGKFDAKKLPSLRIYRSTEKGSLGELIAPKITKRSFTDAKAQSGTTYYYTVRGVDTLGNESRSVEQTSAAVSAKPAKTKKVGKK